MKKNKNIIASYGVCNIGGIAIYDIIYDIDDKVCFTWIMGDNESKVCYSKIRVNNNGDFYFYTRNMKVFLNECIKH